MSASSAARRSAPDDPRDALCAALDDAITRLLPLVAAPPGYRAVLRAALLALLAALERRDRQLPLAPAERALVPLEFAGARDGADGDAALAALRALLDRARGLTTI
ncbi:hypothetical protein [Roseisolibacter agri]|uniref:Uncharacterized protein n=1 Tax=Roseisolibacter agri TaxID=2014610 RepID=A0AA37Q9Y8_9BACT|nr:hypothetical protein [Roseisolibacter agri]GLC25801.1 hypothetical protein rosag_23140 [Roseisolibacter agri]